MSVSVERSNSGKFMASMSQHTLKQLKFVLPGGLVTYLLRSVPRLWDLLENDRGSHWARLSAQMSLVCGLLTISLFLYVLLLPWIKGVHPDFSRWRQSGELSVVIPILTGLMTLGWPLLSFTLSYWTDLGALKGTVASSALYALAFGLLGLIPAPMLKRH